ncbi:MAG: GTPase HflX [Methylacidiphilales bacterium]|nr:GTPase HflX [Candidatus Methylacidiphilales bacterium]
MRCLVIHINYNHYILEHLKLIQFEELELVKLCAAAGYSTMQEIRFTLSHINTNTFISNDRLEQIQQAAKLQNAKAVIFNASLSARQELNIKEFLKLEVRTRNIIILELFSKHAVSSDSKLHVSLARLEISRASLVGHWTHLERQRGGTGTRSGPGETQFESDRRGLDVKITSLRKKIKKVALRRKEFQYRKRDSVFRIAIVGYTNSGKTTLFNALSRANRVVADQWFATLDPLARRIFVTGLERTTEVVLLDTVGFISHLPKQLKEAFTASLEEILSADLILHVIDCARVGYHDRIAVVENQLSELGVLSTVPIIEIYNKIDLINVPSSSVYLPEQNKYRIYLSALNQPQLPTIHSLIASQIHNNYSKINIVC